MNLHNRMKRGMIRKALTGRMGVFGQGVSIAGGVKRRDLARRMSRPYKNTDFVVTMRNLLRNTNDLRDRVINESPRFSQRQQAAAGPLALYARRNAMLADGLTERMGQRNLGSRQWSPTDAKNARKLAAAIQRSAQQSSNAVG